MKFTIIFLTAFVLGAQARGDAQKVTLAGKDMSLRKVLAAVKQQTGYVVFYASRDLLRDARPVTLVATDMPLRSFLAAALKGQPIRYEIEDNTIALFRKSPASAKGDSVTATNDREAAPQGNIAISDILIRGRVTDSTGVPLAGATVKVRGTNNGTLSDGNGNFNLSVPNGNAVLEVSFVGYATASIRVGGEKFFTVRLNTIATYLDESIVQAYGTTTKRTTTGNISTVSAADIEKQPVTNVLQALEGRVPGLMISQVNGQPGSGVNVQIRAANSLASGTAPLYIIDGVPFVSEALYTAGGNNVGFLKPSYGSSPLNALNPSDIESISVLKDADATALYGSRGANGVILINTKRAKGGKSNLDVNFSQGLSAVQNLHRIANMSMSQYLEVRHRAYINAGTTPTINNAPDLLVWDTTKTTDFQDLLFGGTAQNTDASVSFSGGTEFTNFLLSGTYHNEGQVIPGDANYKRGAFHLALGHQSHDRKFGLNASVTYNLDKNKSSARTFQSADLANIAFSLPPNYPVYDSTGNLYYYSSSYDNPLSYIYQKYTATNYNLIGNITLRYSPAKGLNLKVSSSYNRLSMYSQNLNYSKSINKFSSSKPSANFQENYTNAWNVEPQAEYTHRISKGRLNVLAGATFQGNNYVQPFYIVATNYNSDFLLNNFTSAGSYTAYSFNSAYKYSSVFGRANYNWLDKYILNLNYRWDASSKFGINNRYGSFASLGAAWIFTEEKAVKDVLPWLSFGKLRGSYGSSGNDQISNYQYYDTYATGRPAYDGVNSLYPNNVANPNLKWEVNKKLELAMNLGFLKDRILISGAWFLNKTSNPLVSYPLAALTGFSSYTANMDATIQTKGTEFELTTQNIKGKDFTWTTAFNISFPQSKLARFDNILQTGYTTSSIVGESMSSIHLFKYTGIDPTTSLPSFFDANGNGVSNYPETGLAAYGNGDYVTVGKTDPAFFGGMNNSLQFKGFQLDVFIQFVGKRMVPGIRNSNYLSNTNPPGRTAVNMYEGLYDLYKETNGKIATTAFAYSPGTPYISYIMYAKSSATISNAAYARLKNVSLSYTLPRDWSKKYKVSNCTLFARAQNLFTVTNFEGYDPESAPNNIPPLHTIIFGLKCSF